MCGFVGCFGISDIELEEARVSINSRGPDMHSVDGGEDWKIAFNRLSIHDLSENGMQPFWYDDVVVYMNGEIYNYLELLTEHSLEFAPSSDSDVEIVPFLYRKYGLDFLDKLNGMFALVIIDEKHKKKYLIRDRFGKKPLYYYRHDDNLLFASEVKAISKLCKLEVDKTNIKINFACWFLPQPLSLYKGVFNVYPGSIVEWDGRNIAEQKWYKPAIKKSNDSESEIEAKFLELYKSAIELRLRSDVPVGVFLSGGLDSTSIAKFSFDAIGDRFSSFTAEIIGKERFENNTDVEVPKKLSSDMKINNYSAIIDYDFYNKNIVRIVAHYDEIFVNSGVMVFYLLSELAKQNNTSVILTGVGGDELFGGYPWQSMNTRKLGGLFPVLMNRFYYSSTLERFFRFFGKKAAYFYKIISDYHVWHAQTLPYGLFFDRLWSDKTELEDKIRGYAKNYFDNAESAIRYDDVYNKMHYADIYTVMGGQNYLADMGCMYSSVENRSPFEDFRLYEYMMSVPDNIKIKYGQKGLLRKFLSKHLPDYVVNAKKSGPTMPLNVWFYEDKERCIKVKNFILNNAHIIKEYLSDSIYKKVLKGYDGFFSIRHSMRIFAVINLILWVKINITGEIKNYELELDEIL